MVLKLGKDESFFTLLEDQAGVAVRAAEELLGLADGFSKAGACAAMLLKIEGEGDDLTHSLQRKLSGTFITPLDQEDLNNLSHLLDDVTDYIETIGARINMYKLTEVRPDFRPLATNLLELAKAISMAVGELQHQFHRSATLPELIVRIHTLENDSDVLYRGALVKLFEDVSDPILLIKWKEVYERIEHAADKCEALANVIDNMIVKYA